MLCIVAGNFVLANGTEMVKVLVSTSSYYIASFTQERLNSIIIQSVDSISRDGPDTPIYNIIHYKKRNNSEQENF